MPRSTVLKFPAELLQRFGPIPRNITLVRTNLGYIYVPKAARYTSMRRHAASGSPTRHALLDKWCLAGEPAKPTCQALLPPIPVVVPDSGWKNWLDANRPALFLRCLCYRFFTQRVERALQSAMGARSHRRPFHRAARERGRGVVSYWPSSLMKSIPETYTSVAQQ